MTRIWPLAALAVIATISPLRAADLGKPEPAKVAEIAQAAPAPFQGLYVGAMLGHATGTTSDADGFKFPRDGYTASGLIGYNHRLPSVVVGIEVDLGVTDVTGSTNAGGFTVSGSSKALGSVRARVGVPLGMTLIYGTAGFAMTNARLAVESVGADTTNRLNGYVFGAGIEAALLGNLGLRLEVLRYQWRDQSYAIGGQDTGKLGSHDDHIRAGLIVRLN